MADLMPKSHTDVLVTLSDKSPDHPRYASRKIVLTSNNKIRQIGRSSSRHNVDLAASTTNAWFDNAVMSRAHADLIWDPDTQLVFIRDTDSLHGTTLNGFRLPSMTKKRLQVGDMLTFGVPVEKESKAFQPTAVQIGSIDLGPPEFVYSHHHSNSLADLAHRLPPRESRTNTFTVPDESEVEDASADEDLFSDSDDGGVAHSAMLLQQSNMMPNETSQLSAQKTNPPMIDLTDDPLEDGLLPDVTPVKTPTLPPTEHTPSTVKIDETPTTTFAPALRHLQSDSPTQKAKSNIVINEPNENMRLPSGSLRSVPGGLGWVETPRNPAHTAPNSTSLSTSPPTTLEERASRLAMQARERIAKRMAEERNKALDPAYCRPVAESNPPALLDAVPIAPSLPPSYHQTLLQAQQAHSGQKRKFADFSDPEPVSPFLDTWSESSAPQTVALSQVVGTQTPLKSNASDFRSTDAKVSSPCTLVSQSTQPQGPRSQPAESQATHATMDVLVEPAPINTPQTSIEAVHRPEPPRKRMRRVAEAMGYAALGGIAVVSALIATAPDL